MQGGCRMSVNTGRPPGIPRRPRAGVCAGAVLRAGGAGDGGSAGQRMSARAAATTTTSTRQAKKTIAARRVFARFAAASRRSASIRFAMRAHLSSAAETGFCAAG